MHKDDGSDDSVSPVATTPIQVCGGAIGRLADIWDEIAERVGEGKGKFIEEVFGPMWGEGAKGQTFEEEINHWDEQPEDLKPLGILAAMLTSCAYACQGMMAQKDGDHILAWRYTARCEYWLGVVVGSWSLRRLQDKPGAEFARLGADARHKENRDMKTQALEWYAANKDKVGSKDSAAEAIAGKVVPVKFRTARDWLKGV